MTEKEVLIEQLIKAGHLSIREAMILLDETPETHTEGPVVNIPTQWDPALIEDVSDGTTYATEAEDLKNIIDGSI